MLPFTQAVLFLAVLILCGPMGCTSNPYSQFYVAKPQGASLKKDPYLVPNYSDPHVFGGLSPEADGRQMVENGYVMIGYSSFGAPYVDAGAAVKQAKKLKAKVVVLYPGGAQQGKPGQHSLSPLQTIGASVSPWLDPYFRPNASHSTYYDVLATYWVKHKPSIFGAWFNQQDWRGYRTLQARNGLLVTAVERDSPASKANILTGDVLNEINGSPLSIVNVHKVLEALAGKKVQVNLTRNGYTLDTFVQLNSKAY